MKRYLFCLLSLLVLMANESFAKVQDNGTQWILPLGSTEGWNMKYIMCNKEDDAPSNDTNGNSWIDLNYDDSSWQTLTGPMGSEGNGYIDQNFTFIDKAKAFYLRRSFNLDKIPTEDAWFKLLEDDGVQVYLNGNLIVQVGEYMTEWRSFSIPSSAFVKGKNQLSIYYYTVDHPNYLDYGIYVGEETTPSTYTDSQGVIYKLNSAKNAYTVTGHTDDFNLDLTIPNQLFGIPVTAIGDEAFYASDLQSIVLPEGLKVIGHNTFHGCNLSSILIPASVTDLYRGDNTFSANKNLKSIVVAEGNTVYDSRDNCNAIIEKATNRLVTGCFSTTIPASVTSIAVDAMYGASFNSFTIPANVQSIGSISFGSCNELKSFIVKNKTPFSIDGNVFGESNHNVFEYATLYVPKGCKTAYQQANVWNNFQNIVEMDGDVPGGDDIIMIDDSTFSALTFEGVRMVFKILDPVAKTVQVGNDTVSIDRSTAGTVTIPTFVNGYTVVGIGRSGFNSCAELTTVWLPDSLRFIGDYAFYGCTKLRTIQIPETVYGISESAFVGCSGLTSVSCPYIPGVNLGVVFPPSANLEIVGYKASDEDYDVVIPRLVNSIGQRTFSHCLRIRTMRVEEGNNVYDSREKCNAIILTAENKLLYGCKNTIIPESVTAINSYAFEGHTGLVAIAIPAAVKTIGNGAFTACTGLTSVTSRIKTPYAIDDSVFSGQTYRTATLYVPVGTKSLYQKAKGWKNFLNIVEQEEVNPENCEPYAVYQDGVLTFYYDDKRGTRDGTVYELNKGYNYPGWYNDHRTEITKAVFDDSFAGARPTSTRYWFAVEYNETSNLTEIQGIQNLNTSNVTNMSYMFYGCNDLTSLDVSHFDTSNVTNMSYMFYGCNGLTSLDVSHFDTSNVTSMGSMFHGCSGLTSLDVSHFDTRNVRYMNGMFAGCSGLTSLDVSHFNTENVTNMVWMFFGCSGLTSLDVSHFDTRNVTTMYDMFYGCSNLTSLDVSHFDTRNVTSMGAMFYGCSGLTSLDVSRFDTGNVTDMGGMFSGCRSLTSLDVIHFDTGNVTNMGGMFYGCSSLTSLDLSHFDTGNVTNMSQMFSGCRSLTSLDVIHFDTGNVTNMSQMFYGCSSLTSLDVSHFDTGNVTRMNQMFQVCSGLTSLDVSHFDTGNVTDMRSMFSDCSGLTSLDVSHFDTRNVTSMGAMFYGCSNLTSLDVSHFDTSNVTSMGAMFRGCSGLTSLDLSHFDTSNVTDMLTMFYGCSSLTSLNVSHFDTGNVTNMSNMFRDCSSLTSLDVSHFDTNNVTNMYYMFYGCSNMSTIYCDDTWTCSSSTYMFLGCTSLPGYQYANITVDYAKPIDLGGYFTRVENNPNGIIDFADAEVKRICVENWDTNGDGELSYGEAAAVTDLGQVFKNNRNIKSFEELQYFKGLTILPECAFQTCMNLVKVKLPKTIVKIEHSVFENCYKLSGITLHEGIESIDWAAFSSCRSITSVIVPASTTSISNNPFSHCSILSEVSVAEGNPVYDSRNNCNAIIETATNTLVIGCNKSTIPEGIVKLGSLAFAGYSVFTSIELPSTLETLANQVFIDCASLTSIDLKNVKYIGYACFSAPLTAVHIPSTVEWINTSNPFGVYYGTIESITVDPNNQYYDSRDNCNAIITKNLTNAILRDGKEAVNVLISGCKNTIIPNSVRAIGSDAFEHCKMKTIDIPEGVESILYSAFIRSEIETIELPKSLTFLDECAFYECAQLTSVTVKNVVPLPIASSTFNTRSSITLYVPYGCKAAYEAADYWKEFKEIIEVIPDNYLHANDVTVRPGVQKTITLQLDNENTFIAGEFRLQLPAGMRIETDEDGEPVANLVSGRSNKHTLMVTDEGNGLYHFMFYSGQNRAILGNSGDFISLSVIADEGVEDGSYTAKLKNVFFSTEDEKRIDLPDVDFNIVVLDYTPGDVNGDGLLNVMDVVKLVNYIMGRNPSDFVFAAADMDENGKINVMDLVNVVEVIMAAPQHAPAMSMAAFGNLELDRTSKNTVSLSVPDADRHIAAQFTVTLSGNAVLKDVLSDDAHQSKVTRMADGRYKVMVYSGRNDSFRSDSPISLQLSGNSDVKIDDVVFVDADEEAVAYEPVMTNTTGIMSVGTEFSQPTDIYTVNGSLVKKGATSTRGLASGVYIVNNEKVVIK